MRKCWGAGGVLLFLLVKGAAASEVPSWTLENPSLKVTVSAPTLGLSVLDKRNGVTWESEDPGPVDVEAAVDGQPWAFGLAGAEIRAATRITTPQYQGLRVRLAKELGYVLELHDNYRDYYLDTPSFSEQYTVKGADGKSPRWSYWHGGIQSVLCGQVAPQFVERNMQALAAHQALPGGGYFDVFDAAPLDECGDTEHPMSREQCAQARQRCFRHVTSRGLLCASEGGSDWSIPATTHVNSVAITELGVQVPLYSLVYHDAAIVYGWFFGGASELNCALHTFAPRLQPFVWPPWQEVVERIADLNRRLAGVEMTDHRFVNEARTVQETRFANGTTVTADFERLRYRITGLPGWPSGWRGALVMGFPVRVRVSQFEALADRQFRFTFEWETKAPLPPATRCFVHFLHPEWRGVGHIVAGLDHPLPQSADTWPLGQPVSDGPYTAFLPEAAPTGEYSVIIGLLCPPGYRLPERLPLYWDSSPPTGSVLLGKLKVELGEGKGGRFEAVSGAW